MRVQGRNGKLEFPASEDKVQFKARRPVGAGLPEPGTESGLQGPQRARRPQRRPSSREGRNRGSAAGAELARGQQPRTPLRTATAATKRLCGVGDFRRVRFSKEPAEPLSRQRRGRGSEDPRKRKHLESRLQRSIRGPGETASLSCHPATIPSRRREHRQHASVSSPHVRGRTPGDRVGAVGEGRCMNPGSAPPSGRP